MDFKFPYPEIYRKFQTIRQKKNSRDTVIQRDWLRKLLTCFEFSRRTGKRWQHGLNVIESEGEMYRKIHMQEQHKHL